MKVSIVVLIYTVASDVLLETPKYQSTPKALSKLQSIDLKISMLQATIGTEKDVLIVLCCFPDLHYYGYHRHHLDDLHDFVSYLYLVVSLVQA